ncbi:hypothetical protein [Rhodanobacter sp. C03]|uniref:hypothetical protein n=1 Tax=Rhodanobacter sp. C03 TaxID=1945858 RepID=UPI0009864B8E|nr:hypothetical protein [Rhodanobacter sp. C03]OOG59870.1 hypothetical protein B0E48_03530 [Rhodanobacter sp. C03]
MNDHAYDISYLLESELVKADVPELRVAKAPPAPPPVSYQSALAAAQEAMARELLEVAEAHEELIRQYLRFSSGSLQDPFGQ